jgi:hypothetical protein
MITTNEIIDKELKDGRDYIYIGGERYRIGDCFLQNGLEVTVREICDPAHFTDDRKRFWHSYMFYGGKYDRKCEHCTERNEDNKTQDRAPAAVVADKARAEREAFRMSTLQNKPFQVYDDYNRIYFYEKMCWHLVKDERGQSTKESEELLKCGDKLLENMYRHFADCREVSVDTNKGRTDFIKAYLESQNQIY